MYIGIHIHIFIHMYMYIHIHFNIHIHMYIQIYIHMYIHMYVHIHIYICLRAGGSIAYCLMRTNHLLILMTKPLFFEVNRVWKGSPVIRMISK